MVHSGAGHTEETLDCDYDRLHELIFMHLDVRRTMGLSDLFDRGRFSYRTMLRNVPLFTTALLDEISHVVVQAGSPVAWAGARAALADTV
ncbi:MAG: hypothetical protein OXN97_17080 [Bryobacterales bacterium]|nr:hypothetical protein [Bryobacterales bacterium]